jgi:hypothetical protein
VVLNPGTPDERELPGSKTCGGGGWGDPHTRDPMRVRQDVARGFVTVRGALEDYGVALDPTTWRLTSKPPTRNAPAASATRAPHRPRTRLRPSRGAVAGEIRFALAGSATRRLLW